MKNNFKIFLISLLIIFLQIKCVLSENFKFEANELNYLNDEKILKGIGNIKIIDNSNNSEIYADEFKYNKGSQILYINGNIKFIDQINDLVINAQNLTYYKKLEKIISDKLIEAEIQNKYIFESNNIEYLRNERKISSNKLSSLKDNIGNIFKVDNYEYFINKGLINTKKLKLTDLNKNKYLIEDAIINLNLSEVRGKKINLIDIENNNYFVEDAMVNLNLNEIIGKDVSINLDKNTFNNPENDPRMKGNSIFVSKDKTTLTKGVFTTCKKRDKCPPWVLSAKQIEHDKQKKQINYKDAWLKLYDVPVLYFPSFFHPDPTVKRQSGFLIPTISNSNTFGSMFSIPYYHVISDNKDLTFSPRIYSNRDILLQSEYRQVNKNTKHNLDLSLFSQNKFGLDFNEPKGHFFSNSNYSVNLKNFDESFVEMNIQQTSEESYLKSYNLKSPLINSNTTLNSYVDFNASREDLSISSSVEVFEKLTPQKSNDRFEFIYPNIEIVKDTDLFKNFDGNVTFHSNFYQKKYNTNVYEGALINDLRFNSNTNFTDLGLLNKFKFLFKNVNTKAKKSHKYRNSTDTQLLSAVQFETSYPLSKTTPEGNNLLTPTASIMFSPNKSRNIVNEDRPVNTNNIFSFDRIASSETVEGGLSLTVGSNFKKINKQEDQVIELDLAQVFRVDENNDLPSNSTIGNTSSDIIGKLKLEPNKYFNLEYDFSLDNSLSESNYNLIKSEISVNKLVTSFEYLKEDNIIGDESYLSYKTEYNFSDSGSISASSRVNKKTNLTEFYNLVYEYKNDCLVASVGFDKKFYNDTNLKPEKNLFFTVTIKPFGKVKGPNISKLRD